MNLISSTLFRSAAVALALPLLGVSAAVQINSTCYGPGSCTSPANITDSVTSGNPVSGTFSQNVLIGTDKYSVYATYSTTYTGASETISFSPSVTYTGTLPSTSNDALTIDFLQDIFDPRPGPFSASTQTEDVPLNIPVGATASGQLFVNGTALPLIGPFGPGNYDVSNTQSFGPIYSDYLGYDYQFTFDFSSGVAPGTSIASVPEPSQTIPAALTLAGFVLVAMRRRKK